ncbi:MAG TPA: hypothetical protein VHK67_03755, partial [Rhabdochlamydiaceae bacterium]|nr:hypothetical protein [Rhabdochlamydiaceae bacterium]
MSLPTATATQHAVLSLNFKGFFERSDLFSYRNLFASEADTLKWKSLCEAIIKMDEQEYSLVKSESDELDRVASQSRSLK